MDANCCCPLSLAFFLWVRRPGPQLAHLVSSCHMSQIRNRLAFLPQDALLPFLENRLNMMILLDQDGVLPSARKLSVNIQL